MIKPIETVYNDYRFRSRLEARWAVFFDQIGVEYQYEPEGFKLSDGTYYLPDFYLPYFKCYVEIKPKGLNTYEEAKNKCITLFGDLKDQITMLCIGDPMDNNMRIFCNDSSDSGAGIMYDGWKAEFLRGVHFIHNATDEDDGEWFQDKRSVSMCVYVVDEERVLCTSDWNNLPAFKFHYDHEIINYRDDLEGEMLVARQARFEHGECGGPLTLQFGDKTISPALFNVLCSWNHIRTPEELKNTKLGDLLEMHGIKENINEIISIL